MVFGIFAFVSALDAWLGLRRTTGGFVTGPLGAAWMIVGSLLGGAVVVEYVFARPGLGSLMVDSVFQRDYGVLQTLVLLASAAFIVTSFVVDVLYGVVDPRLRAVRSAH